MPHTYSMSFTSATLLHHESMVVMAQYERLQDWTAVRTAVLSDNLLQMQTENSAKRIYVEVAGRLKKLTAEQHAFLPTATHREQKLLLWLAVCKRYRFIHEFAVTVVREKYLRLDYHLTYDDYDIYFMNKAEWHPEVDSVAESTRAKQRQVVFKMMREADLLTDHNQIRSIYLSAPFIACVAADDPVHLTIYPVSAADLEEWRS